MHGGTAWEPQAALLEASGRERIAWDALGDSKLAGTELPKAFSCFLRSTRAFCGDKLHTICQEGAEVGLADTRQFVISFRLYCRGSTCIPELSELCCAFGKSA